MRQAQKKKDKDKVAVALMLAFCVIALTSIFTIKSNIDKINGSGSGHVPVSDPTQTSALDKQPQPGSRAQPDKQPAAETPADPAQASAKVPTVDSAGDKSAKAPQTSGFTKPVKGEDLTITNEYAMDHLIYSVTLDQYMTHCGIDIEAPADTQVLAAAAGVVTAVYTDDRYGLSVEITHPGDVVTIYSNLSTTEMVEIGDEVKQGQIIGGIGATGLFEALKPPHLHFEMLKDGVYVDPQKSIRF